MAEFTFEVIGNRLILDNLAALETEIIAKLDNDALPAAAAVGEQTAKSLARVDTGEMQSKVYTLIENHQIILGDDSDHAVYNELGTYKMSAAPFLVPGAIAAGEELKKQLTGLI